MRYKNKKGSEFTLQSSLKQEMNLYERINLYPRWNSRKNPTFTKRTIPFSFQKFKYHRQTIHIFTQSAFFLLIYHSKLLLCYPIKYRFHDCKYNQLIITKPCKNGHITAEDGPRHVSFSGNNPLYNQAKSSDYSNPSISSRQMSQVWYNKHFSHIVRGGSKRHNELSGLFRRALRPCRNRPVCPPSFSLFDWEECVSTNPRNECRGSILWDVVVASQATFSFEFFASSTLVFCLHFL